MWSIKTDSSNISISEDNGASHLVVIAASKEPHVVDHGEAGGEELNGTRHEVVAGIAMQRREVGAVVLVGVPSVAPVGPII